MTPLQSQALDILNSQEEVSTAFLQRKMKVNYEVAKELMEWLATCDNVYVSNDLIFLN